MAQSEAVYVVYDKLIKADVFPFMAQHDGLAKGELYVFCNRMKRTDFALYRIASFDFDHVLGGHITPVDIDRVYVCDASPEFIEDLPNAQIEA